MGERAVANLLKHLYPNARRSFGQSRNGDETPDVVGTPFWIEATTGANPNLFKKLAQAQKASRETPNNEYRDKPIIVFANHERKKQRVVLMEEDAFLELLTTLLS